MNITHYEVHPALKGFVECIFHLNREPQEDGAFLQTSLPSHECYLSFEYDTDFLIRKNKAQGFVPGHITTIIPPQIIKTELSGNTMRAIMVKFKNGGFFRLFKIPITHFKNDCYNARDVLGKDFGELFERILNTEDIGIKISMVEQFLSKRLKYSIPYMPMDLAVEKLLLNNGNIPVSELASSACMSVRQLQRKFMEQFGLSPKHYSKFIRFSNARHMRTLFPQFTWGEISMRCGYFDQMHLIHDFKSIAALNPCELDTGVSNLNIFLFPTHRLIE